MPREKRNYLLLVSTLCPHEFPPSLSFRAKQSHSINKTTQVMYCRTPLFNWTLVSCSIQTFAGQARPMTSASCTECSLQWRWYLPVRRCFRSAALNSPSWADPDASWQVSRPVTPSCGCMNATLMQLEPEPGSIHLPGWTFKFSASVDLSVFVAATAGGTVLQLRPLQYLFYVRYSTYCLGVFDNGNSGALIGGIAVRNVLTQVGYGSVLRKSKSKRERKGAGSKT